MEHVTHYRYRRVWARVRKTYESGFMVSESGLQAALYMELRREFRAKGVVVGPHWENRIPDMTIVSDNQVSDILELKFVPKPKNYPVYEENVRKLLEYRDEHHVRIDPFTGQRDKPLPIRSNCRLHFVVIGQSGSDAVWPENISDRIIHWFGRVSAKKDDRHWDVCHGKNRL